MQGLLSRAPPVERSTNKQTPEKWQGVSDLIFWKCAESYRQNTSPYTSIFICIISPSYLLLPVLLVQCICCFEESCAFTPASIPSPSLLGSLDRGRGGGGRGILHCLPWEELLENWIHTATDLLQDRNNQCWWRTRKKILVPYIIFCSRAIVIKSLVICTLKGL